MRLLAVTDHTLTRLAWRFMRKRTGTPANDTRSLTPAEHRANFDARAAMLDGCDDCDIWFVS